FQVWKVISPATSPSAAPASESWSPPPATPQPVRASATAATAPPSASRLDVVLCLVLLRSVLSGSSPESQGGRLERVEVYGCVFGGLGGAGGGVQCGGQAGVHRAFQQIGFGHRGALQCFGEAQVCAGAAACDLGAAGDEVTGVVVGEFDPVHDGGSTVELQAHQGGEVGYVLYHWGVQCVGGAGRFGLACHDEAPVHLVGADIGVWVRVAGPAQQGQAHHGAPAFDPGHIAAVTGVVDHPDAITGFGQVQVAVLADLEGGLIPGGVGR